MSTINCGGLFHKMCTAIDAVLVFVHPHSGTWLSVTLIGQDRLIDNLTAIGKTTYMWIRFSMGEIAAQCDIHAKSSRIGCRLQVALIRRICQHIPRQQPVTMRLSKKGPRLFQEPSVSRANSSQATETFRWRKS